MASPDLRKLARRVIDLHGKGTTDLAESTLRIDTGRYLDLERHEQEKQLLFREYPQLVGLSCDLPGPNDYFALEVADVPVLVTRNKAGELRAFLNVCRHRGARVMQGRGSARSFVCPYHAWCYDDEGDLIGVPERDAFGDFESAPERCG